MEDFIAIRRLDVSHATGPELGRRLDHRIPVVAQPSQIARSQVVLPLRDRDVTVDMDLAQRICLSKMGRLVAPIVWISLPRIHRTLESMLPRALPRLRQSGVAECNL